MTECATPLIKYLPQTILSEQCNGLRLLFNLNVIISDILSIIACKVQGQYMLNHWPLKKKNY